MNELNQPVTGQDDVTIKAFRQYMPPTMKELLLEDDSTIACDFFANLKALPGKGAFTNQRQRFLYRKILVLNDGGDAAAAMINALNACLLKGLVSDVSVVAWNDPVFAGDTKLEQTAIFLFADAQQYEKQDQWLKQAGAILAVAGAGKQNFCVVCVNAPFTNSIPEGIESLAEREYDYFLQHYAEVDPRAKDFFFSTQDLCRAFIRKGFRSVSVIRTLHACGPEHTRFCGFDFAAFLKSALEKKTVSLDECDFKTVYSLVYVTDIVMALMNVLYNSVPCHVYNLSAGRMTRAEVKWQVWHLLKDRLKLEVTAPPLTAQDYCVGDSLKIRERCEWQPGIPLNDAITKIASYCLNENLDKSRGIEVYGGKLPQIKHLEMEILREIDRLCKKHSIRYFLAGGTLLGALRYGNSIPWDDDLDIGFSRSDFDKFRKVCATELSDRFVHSCYYNETKSHYVVDKIRLKDTWFSTRYSSLNASPDGIFVDCLVYDATSDRKIFEKLHCLVASLLTKAIAALWIRKVPPKKKFKGIYLILRMFPLSWIQQLFEKILKIYQKKSPRRVIDSTGKLIAKGGMDAEKLFTTSPFLFEEGFTAPIPQRLDHYLTFAYGRNYVAPPALSKRIAPHDYARIDLGSYVFSELPQKDFPPTDPQGELWEESRTSGAVDKL